MVRPEVADGGDVLQIWRVAANVLNKQTYERRLNAEDINLLV
jgi:hypothetical protein